MHTLTRTLVRMGVFVALLIISAQIAFPIPFTMVPVTLQTLAIMLICVALKPTEAVLTVTCYVLMGLMGVPVFAGFNSFPALLSPTGGFILAFIPATAFMANMVSLLEKRFAKDKVQSAWHNTTEDTNPCMYSTIREEYASNRINEQVEKTTLTHQQKKQLFLKYTFLVLIVIGFTAIIYAGGSTWFMVFMRNFADTTRPIAFSESLLLTAVPFLPGDAIKAAAAILAYTPLIKLRNL